MNIKNYIPKVDTAWLIGCAVFMLLGLFIGNRTTETYTHNIVIEVDSIPSFFGQTPNEGLYDAMDYYGIRHPEIVYKQALLETGNFTSDVCLKYNNLFGLYNSRTKDYYKFNHWQESVVAYKNFIQYSYKGGDYYKFLKEFGYAEDVEYINKLKSMK